MADGSITIDTKMNSKEVIKELDKLGYKMKEVGENGNGFLSKVGSGFKSIASTGLKAMAVGLGAVATGTIALGKSALSSYADYEQLVGGVETLFKDNASTILKYSQDAYKTANLSANEYMNTITSFSASLISSLGGDTKKASEIGNQAIVDMSDNANKMGTSMESIQNAYQGFAKQNYTMLDNLKLGYGGTKEEMQRLLDDANKLNAQQGKNTNYTISNFADIVNAIHDIQTNLDITGTTAKESATTISGSVNTMKSAWSNLLTELANKNGDLKGAMANLSDSIIQVGQNVGAVIPTILESILTLVNEFASNMLPNILAGVPNLINTLLPMVLQAFTSLITAIANALPLLKDTLVTIIPMLVESITSLLPMLLESGIQAIIMIGQGLAQTIPTLIPIVLNCIITMCDTIINNLDSVFDTAIEIIFAIVDGIISALPTLIEEVPRIINEFCSKLYDQLPKLLQKGVELLLEIGKGLMKALPTFIKNIPQILKAILNVWTLFNWGQMGKNAIEWIKNGIMSLKNTLPTTLANIGRNALQWIKNAFLGGTNVGSGLISNIIGGIRSLIGSLLGVVGSIGSSVINSFGSILSPSTLVDVGRNLLSGLWNGISSMAGVLYDRVANFASGITDKIKSVFKIFSPSRVMRDEIGVMLVKGIGVGFDRETPNLEKDIDYNMNDLIDSMYNTVGLESSKFNSNSAYENSGHITNNDNGITQNVTIVNPERTPSENARLLKQVARGLMYG